MARVRSSAGAGRMRIPGLYAALLAREREYQAGHDQFVAQNPEYQNARTRRRDRRVLDALESGRPAVLQGRRLKGWGIPKVPLSREQSMAWFAVSADDTVTPTEEPK